MGGSQIGFGQTEQTGNCKTPKRLKRGLNRRISGGATRGGQSSSLKTPEAIRRSGDLLFSGDELVEIVGIGKRPILRDAHRVLLKTPHSGGKRKERPWTRCRPKAGTQGNHISIVESTQKTKYHR